MTDGGDRGAINLRWARTLVGGLATNGVDTVVIAPGSRSTPLVLAAAEHDDVVTLSHLDERAGGYLALGRGRASGRPTAVVTTSGTATANLLPAVMEAHEARVPLLVLTGDRPPELHHSGANQTTTQDRLYADFVRWSRQLPEAADDAHRRRSLRATAARAVAEARGPPAGPVHLNCPFRKPLQPEAPRSAPAADDAAPTVTPAGLRPSTAEMRRLATRLEANERGLIVVGPAGLDADAATAVIALAEVTGYPILADPLSGLRHGHDGACVVAGGYDGYLSTAVRGALGRPSLVLRIGPPPVSTRLTEYLDTDHATQWLVDPAPAWRDGTFRIDALVRGDITDTCTALAERVRDRERSTLATAFERAEAAYWSAADTALSGRYFEGAIAAAVTATAPADRPVFVANSMPVRDVDRFGRPRPDGPGLYGNRGVSGIDGLISSAAGVADATTDRVAVLLGDLAAYHDLNGLVAVERFDLDVTVVIVNNDGGGIFHHLPVEQHDPPFTRLFRTPHGLTFEGAAQQFGLHHRAVHDRTDLAEALGALTDPGSHLLECHVDAERSHRTRAGVTERLEAAVLEALENGSRP